MSTEEEMKQARAEGRTQQVIVQRYLEALEAKRKATSNRSWQQVMDARDRHQHTVEHTDNIVERLKAKQALRDIEADLAERREVAKIKEAEADFVKIAKAFSDRKGIEYATWREMHVPVETLTKAGITRYG